VTVIHVDPRFTRTSAVADLHIPLRAGSDIALLGGLINYVLTEEKDFREYVVAYTNAGTILREDFRDTEDLDGLFSGWDPETRQYDTSSWQYEGTEMATSAGDRDSEYGDRAGEHGPTEGSKQSAQPDRHGSGGASFDGEP